MIFAKAINLWWLLIVLGLALSELLLWRKKQGLLLRLFPGGLADLMLRQWDKNRHLAKSVLFILAIFFLLLSLTSPQWGKRSEVPGRKGIDVMMAIDVSKSMLAKDLLPDRLENAKASLNLILDELAGNRIGLVAFAGTGFVHCPLTTDVSAVKLFLKSINTEIIPNPGTDISSAIQSCIKAFGKSNTSKVIILLTDGEELSGSALTASELAAKEGIRIFAVGIGSLDGAVIPDAGGYKKDRQGNVVLSRANPQLLDVLAKKTKGQAFLLGQDPVGFQKLFAAVAALPKQQIKQGLTYQYQDRFQIFILLSMLLLVMEMLMSERRNG